MGGPERLLLRAGAVRAALCGQLPTRPAAGRSLRREQRRVYRGAGAGEPGGLQRGGGRPAAADTAAEASQLGGGAGSGRLRVLLGGGHLHHGISEEEGLDSRDLLLGQREAESDGIVEQFVSNEKQSSLGLTNFLFEFEKFKITPEFENFFY